MSGSLLPLFIPGMWGPGALGHGMHHLFGGLFMFIGPLIFLLVVVILLSRADRHGGPFFGPPATRWAGHPHHDGPGFGGPRPGGPRQGSPEDEAFRILAERLAKGDISSEDYRERVDTLRTTRAQENDPTAGMPYLGPEDRPPAEPKV